MSMSYEKDKNIRKYKLILKNASLCESEKIKARSMLNFWLNIVWKVKE